MEDTLWSISQLKAYKKQVEKDLGVFLKRKKKEAKKIAPETLYAHEALEEYILRGGKRIRPALIWYGYKLCGGKGIDREVRKLSISIDLTHAFLLIHDDIMDRATTRRGKPALHVALESMYRRQHRKDAQHLGLSQALLLGDFASAYGYEVISEANIPKKLGHEILETYTRMLREVEIGQGLDVVNESRKRVTEEDVKKVIEYKTARYTFLAPLEIGAQLAGASKKQMNAIKRFAIPTGIVFQIADDVLGMFGTEKDIGKSNMSDLWEGKQTYLSVRAYKNASQTDRRFLEKTLGNPKATRKDLTRVRKIMKETGALEETMNEAQQLVEKANHILLKADFPGKDAERFLKGVSEYVLHRKS